MTSISQNTGLPAQGKSNNNTQASSQAHSSSPSVSGTNQSFSATVASDPSNTPVTVGATAQPQHGKTASVSTVNGNPKTQQPAVPTAGGVNIVNGNTMPAPTAQGDHTRKPSFTISAAGATGQAPNGSVGASTRIQFGSQGSPAAGKPATLAQPQASLNVEQPINPRTTSPQTSPSPIPQPILSGGRPPSTLQGQAGPNFGGFDRESPDMNRQMRQTPQGPMGSGPQSQHLRRESSQSAHSDMSNHGMPAGPGRGGYPPHGGGRGRGGYGQHYQQQMPYNQNPNFRGGHNGRGGANMGGQFHGNRGPPLAPPFNGSPHQAARSPALANAHPVTPQMAPVPMTNAQMQGQQYGGYNQHMGPQQVKPQSSSKRFDHHNFSKRRASPHYKQHAPTLLPPHMTVPPPNLAPESGNFEQYLMMMKNQGYNNVPPQGYDPNYAYYSQGYPVHQMQGMQMLPPSPRPVYNVPQGAPQGQYMQPGYMGQGQPAPGTPMSRNSSQVSAPDRPSSSLGHVQQGPGPAAPPVSSHTPSASRGSNNSPAPSSNFTRPGKRNPLIIKDPNGTVKTFDKQPASPARATPSPVKGATPAATPPPRAASNAEHGRSDSKVRKTDEEKKAEMRESVARIRREAEEAAAREKEEEARKVKEEAQRKEREAAEAKEREEAEAKKVAEEKEKLATEEAKKEAPKPATDEEEIDFDAIEKELAEQEAAEAAAEEAYQKKKQAEKEEKARKEKEEAAAYEQNMKAAEREAEAAETERMKKREAEAAGGRKDSVTSLKDKSSGTPTSTGSPAIPTPATSGAATPVSDTSMGPPAKPAIGGKRDKPAALKLETAKAVEPPQPSAAMKSLQSARFLADPSLITYPSSVVSPNPALNPNAPTDRKFKYNKEFLLQFQSVFKEKPSIDWDTRVRETVGDPATDSSRPSSARTPVMGGRTVSRSGTQPFQMGSFTQAPSRSNLPPGTTSEQRFALSNAAARSTSMGGGNPFGQFQRGPGMGMGAPSMSRNSSSAGMQMPSSPRVNASHRGGNRSGSRRDKHSSKKEEESNKSMPLTAGQDFTLPKTSQGGWKPRSVGNVGPAPGGDGHMPPDVVQRKVKSNLNKMTPENFDRISDQILEIVGQSKDESDGRTLRQVIQLTFEKATDEAHWAPMYAKFCKRMLESMSPEIKDENIRDRQDQVVTGGSLFRKYLLNRCQEEFEQGWKVNLPPKPDGTTEEVTMLSDEYYTAAAAKRRGLGLVKFIGELFKLSMLTERIMHACVKKLVDFDGVPEEAEVESLTSLLRTIGQTLDNSEKGPSMMDAYFSRIQMMMETPGLNSRLKFMLMDIIDLRKKRWISKDSDKGPKTIQQIRDEAARAQQEQEMERVRQQANRGGGGRMPMGRGDARNFSGGYGNQPPPQDFASSKVGTDDLRRLGSKAASARNNNQPMSFGPSSMFGSRSSSGRKNLGPGGNLVRGEDSGASSRAGTPPSGKKEDKESASAKNAFSALASLDASESLATSPPSNPSSPSMTKSQPAKEQTTEGTS